MKYEVIIGLEVHAQLLTQSKIFCSCSTKFGSEPNRQTCPLCLGLPGTLPVLNKKVVEFAVKTALVTNCEIAENNIFARKNYFYPDLPKGYQISQYEQPLAINGYLEIKTQNADNKKEQSAEKRIGITRIHLEEDAGKLVHEGVEKTRDSSFVDLNRSGVPLIEIVSEPDMRAPQEASVYLRTLRDILQYLEVCDGNMEEGSFRCDANISLRPFGEQKFGTKTEVKNMNSFKAVEKALVYEIERQQNLLENGESIIQETRLWDAETETTTSMRSKEEAHDYRYFPEPDLIPIKIDRKWIEKIKQELPELPAMKVERFVKEYNIPQYDAEVLTASKSLAEYYEESVKLYNKPKIVSNWIMAELLRELKRDEKEIESCRITPKHLSEMLKMIDNGTISGKIAKTVFEEMYKSGKMPNEIVEEKGLVQVTDASKIEEVIDKIISENQKQVNEYRSGKDKLFGFFVGQVMKETKGKANPKVVNELLKNKLQ